jgi:hypothetical protein
LLCQLLLLLLYYILLLFRPKLRHFPHFFVSCVAIEIIFGEEYLWFGAVLLRFFIWVCLFLGFRVLNTAFCKSFVLFGPVAIATLVQWLALLVLVIILRLISKIFYVTLLVAVFGLRRPHLHAFGLPTEDADVVRCVRASRKDVFAAPVCNLESLVHFISKRWEVLVLVCI